MSSGSSSDLSTTTSTTTTTYDASVPGSYGVGSVYDYNTGPYVATAYGSGNQSRWSGMGTSYDPTADRTAFQLFMNGYQGPLDYTSFENHGTAQNFVPLAAENDAREVELSKIAQQKASSAETRAFADMMVNDHARSSQELMSLASATGVTIPAFNFYASGSAPSSYSTTTTYMGTSGNNAMSVSGSSSMNGNAGTTSSYNGNPALKGDPRIAPPLANDLRDISGFPPEQDTRTPSGNGTGTSTTFPKSYVAGNATTTAPDPNASDPKIAAPLANDLRDISGFPPEQDTRTPSVTGTGTSTTLPNGLVAGRPAEDTGLGVGNLNPGVATTSSVNSGSGSSGNWSATGSSSMTSTSGSTWGSNNSASAMATMNEITALNNLTGAAFDTQYARMMVQDHYQAIELFKSAAKSTDPQVRAYAEKTLPVLRAHYDQARRLK